MHQSARSSSSFSLNLSVSQDSTIGLYMDVDTTSSGFIKNHPTYIASFEAARVEWKATDKWMVGGLFEVKSSSFRIYLDRAHNATIIKDGEWAVNYIGYQVRS